MFIHASTKITNEVHKEIKGLLLLFTHFSIDLVCFVEKSLPRYS